MFQRDWRQSQLGVKSRPPRKSLAAAAFVFVFSSENASSSDKNAAVAASTPVSLAAAVYKKKQKNIVDCFVFFCGPSEQALYLPCKENKDYWSLERWTSEIPVIKI